MKKINIAVISILMIVVFTSTVYAFSIGDFFKAVGKAVTTPANITCTDTDGGLNYNEYGNVSRCAGKRCYSYKDSCSGSSGNVLERYCSGKNVATKIYKCPNGCKDGACVTATAANITCTDSDSGLDYYIKGKISGPAIQDGNSTDECVVIKNTVTLVERYCTDATGKAGAIGDRGATKNYVCSSGYRCSDGACISIKYSLNCTKNYYAGSYTSLENCDKSACKDDGYLGCFKVGKSYRVLCANLNTKYTTTCTTDPKCPSGYTQYEKGECN